MMLNKNDDETTKKLSQEINEAIENLPDVLKKPLQTQIKKEAEIVEPTKIIFDFSHPYISIQYKKSKIDINLDEMDFRREVRTRLDMDYFFKNGKLLYPRNINVFGRILKFYPDGIGFNVYTPAFIMAAGECFEETNHRAEELQFLRQITLDNVDDYEDVDGNKLKLPIEPKDPPPFKNQKVGLHYTSQLMPFALLWEMGTGKTRTAIETFVYHKKRGNVDKCLVVCPLSVMDNWENEIIKWSDCTSDVLRGPRDQKVEILANTLADFIIMNYESVAILEEALHTWIDSGTMIVADESTKVKNPNAKRSKALIKLGFMTKYKIIMTGTPVTQHAYDLFTPFLFLDCGETFGLKYDDFLNTYFQQYGYKWVPYSGSLERISNRMYTRALRFLKKDCLDLPDKMYVERAVELPEYNRQRYNEMVQYAITEIENSQQVTAAIILVQLLRLSQITSGFVKDVDSKEVNFTENPKLDALEDIFEELGLDEDNNGDEDNHNKVVIWTRFHHDVKNIMALCARMKIGAVPLYGEIEEQQRSRNVAKFQEDKETKVLVGTTATGGLGINLTAGNTVVYFSNTYSLQDRLQSEDRTHRAGQARKVTYIDIVAKNTIDQGILKILKQKKNVADVVTKDNLRSIL